MAKSDTNRKSSLRRCSGWVGRHAVRGAAGISTFGLGITVAAMAAAQQGGKFILAPISPEVEAQAAATAAAAPTMVFGVEANTIFFAAAGAAAIFWFTLGGGRKPKVARE